ncbi:MAG: hypothetical protein S4CHLAM81_05560 [Chlamydiales bacterium]|nr:hypothetical protein [Chlamydiales bacterium]MCH9635341.1 hypothetical protein [Chlamydiales bacterium]MCH9703326.1 hypothetical protein [Chlamydiota bacterium]
MKVALLVADNPYGTTRTFARDLQQAFNCMGVRAVCHYVGEGHFHHALYDMLDDPPDLTFSFATIRGLAWNIPHFTFTLDSVLYAHPCKGILSCIDEHDANFASAHFLPHAINPLAPQPKEFDAVFFGTCLDVEKIEAQWQQHHNRDFLFEISRKILYGDAVLIDQVRDLALHTEVDRYIRAYDRIKLCQQFPKLSVWGDGPWKKYLPNAQVYDPVPFEEALQIIAKSRLVLNSSPNKKAGLHERILYAWSAGAKVVTAQNRYVDGYTQGQWEATEGVDGDWSAHTWEKRAQKILEIVDN